MPETRFGAQLPDQVETIQTAGFSVEVGGPVHIEVRDEGGHLFSGIPQRNDGGARALHDARFHARQRFERNLQRLGAGFAVFHDQNQS